MKGAMAGLKTLGLIAFSAGRDVLVLAAGTWLAKYAWEQWEKGLFHPPFIGYRRR
jgi:hypothetical protein